MKKVIIIDDEPLARLIVKEYLKVHSDLVLVDECNNGFEGLKSIELNKPDLIFLDIQMPKINGFEMLEILDEEPPVIFTTAFDEYAIKAFEASAVDYLLKPFTQERFDKALDKWKRNSHPSELSKFGEIARKQPDESQRIVVKDSSTIKIIPTQDVMYIEAYDDYVKVYTKDRYFLKKKTMNYYEQILSKSDFSRIHRSYIINVNQLTRIESFEKNNYKATLTNGVQIPISRSSYSDLKKSLGI